MPLFNKHTAGFTLIEILVAVTLLGILGVLAYRGLDGVRKSSEHISNIAAHWQKIDHAFDHIGQSVRYPARRLGRRLDGSEAPAFWGRPTNELDKDTALLVLSIRGVHGIDDQRIGYFWHDQQLDVLVWNIPESTEMPDQIYTLLTDVDNLEFNYLSESGAWSKQWPPSSLNEEDTNLTDLQSPRALRLIISLGTGVQIERIFAIL